VTITVLPLRPVTVPELRLLLIEKTCGSAETALVEGQVLKSRCDPAPLRSVYAQNFPEGQVDTAAKERA
jgi:hypothetical protein